MKQKSLFEKKIELKSCQINGGRMMTSSKQSSSTTQLGQRSDTHTVTTDDCGNWTDSQMVFSCSC